jgi:hypothetical protein
MDIDPTAPSKAVAHAWSSRADALVPDVTTGCNNKWLENMADSIHRLTVMYANSSLHNAVEVESEMRRTWRFL